MRRRTKRVRLRPRPFIVLALAINLATGAVYSPVTAVRKVRVEGAPEADRTRLTGILQRLKGVPCMRVDARRIESEALQNSELRSASLSRTPFGSAVLHVARRVAVAQLDRYRGIGLTADGVLYASSVPLDDLPKVILPPKYAWVGLTLGNGWRAVDVARLATLVRAAPSKAPIQIELVQGGRVCLNIDTGRVDLGALADLDAKVARLESILRERPDLFVTVKTLSLVKLDNPAYVPRSGALKP